MLTNYRTPTKQQRKALPNREFVEVWMKSATLEQVAQHFEITINQASSKASNLRRKGVALPAMTRRYDEVTELNMLIKKLSK